MSKFTKTFNRLFDLIALEKHDIIVVFLFTFLISLLSLATPLAVQTLVNIVVMGGVLQSLFVVSIILFVLLIFSGVLYILERYVIELIQRRIFIRTAIEAATNAQGLDITFQDTNNSLELMNRFFDVTNVQKSAYILLTGGLAATLQVAVGSLVLLFYSLYFFIVVLIMFLILWFIIGALGKYAITAAVDESYAKYDVVDWLENITKNLRTFKFAGGSNYSARQIDELANNYLDKRSTSFSILIKQDVLGHFVYALGGTFMLGLGGWLVMQGDINVGQFVAAELIIFGVLASYLSLIRKLESVYDLLAGLDKISVLQDLPQERGGSHNVPLQSAVLIEFNQVSFNFDQQDPLINNLTFSLQSGTSNAIIGKSGSGKSTLVDLITGLRSPASGVVMMNGVDLRNANIASLRTQVSLVKDIEVIEATILDNLRLGHKDITVESAMNVLSSLGLLMAVMQLKDGLETKLPITGLPLTNHQLRVLMVARAVMHKPSLILVDELLDDLDEVELKPVLEYLLAGLNQWTLLILTKHQRIANQCQHLIQLESRHEI